MSILQRDHYQMNILDRLDEAERRLSEIERHAKTGAAVIVEVSVGDVSNPPTDAEMDSLFGSPAEVGIGHAMLLNDAGGASNEYFVWSDGLHWWYMVGTKVI